MNGIKIELKPAIPKENERLCETCGGVGWLYDKERGCIKGCSVCYSGVLHLCPICHLPQRGICTTTTCRKIREEREEKVRFEKAAKVKYEDVPQDHKEMLYSVSYPYNEGYFGELEDLIDHCDDEGKPIPPYVWSTERKELSMDAGSIIEQACEELHEEAYQSIPKEREKELQDFLDAWCAKQTGTTTYTVDYKYAIITAFESKAPEKVRHYRRHTPSGAE